MVAQRRDDLELLVREAIDQWGLKRLCFALADYCYAEARTDTPQVDAWRTLAGLFTQAEVHATMDLTHRDNGA